MVQTNENRRVPVSAGLPIETRLPMDDPSVIHEVEEYCAALEKGDRPDRGRLLDKFPEIVRELTECLDGLELVYQVGHPLEENPEGDRPGDGSRQSHRFGTLGDFRIIREIGRGGMGVVYEAEQISLKRSVALKVLPFAAVFDPRHLQRPSNEALAAASLDHPNVVSVYSVGCERGVYYYAMQYVEGPTLAEMIRDLRRIEELEGEPTDGINGTTGSMPSAQSAAPEDGGEPSAVCADDTAEASPAALVSETRPMAAFSTDHPVRSSDHLRLIAQLGINMAQALDHAHRHGVIHRDIKPSNVIINIEGRACVTDFGLARMEAEGSLTLSGDLLGTVRYMSPEQALATRAVVDHRTDVYSLGATLYELLTLRPAFTGNDRNELLRQITWEEPTAPHRLNRAIPADLETIVLKAMGKAPVDRYATAEELAEDLRRFLDNRPILARRPSLIRQLAKWSQRHQSVMWSVVILLLLTTIGFAFSTALVSREHARTTHALAQSEENLRAARDTVNSYLIRVSEDKMLDIPPLARLRAQLLRLALVYYQRFVCKYSNDPTLQTELADALFRVGSLTAQTDVEEGGLARADELHQEALEIRKRLAREYPGRDEHLVGLALSYSAAGALDWLQADPEAARDAFGEANRIWEGLAAKDPTGRQYGRDLARSYGNLGVLEDESGNPDAAIDCYRKAVEVLKQLVADEGLEHPDVEECLANCYAALGTSQRKTGDLDGAEQSQRAGLAIRKALVDRYPHSTHYEEVLSCSWVSLAESQTAAGALDEALDSRREAIEVHRRLVDENPGVIEYRAALVKGYRELADLQERAGKPEDAVGSLSMSAEIAAKIAGANPAVYSSHEQLATACLDLGDMPGDLLEMTHAMALREKAHQVMEELAAKKPANPVCQLGLAYSYISLGLMQRRLGNLEDALDSFRQSRSICEKLAAEYPGVAEYELARASACSHVARGLRATGGLDEALESQRAAVEIFGHLVAEDLVDPFYRYCLANAYQDLSTLEQDFGRTDEAESAAFNARRILRELAAEDLSWLEHPVGTVRAPEERAEEGFFESLPGLVGETPPYHGPNADHVLAWRLATSPLAARFDSVSPQEPGDAGARPPDPGAGSQNTVGAMQYRAGDWSAAVDTLQQSIELRLKRNGVDLFCLAMAHWRLGEKQQARDCYTQAVEWMNANAPDDHEFRRYQAEAEALWTQAEVAP